MYQVISSKTDSNSQFLSRFNKFVAYNGSNGCGHHTLQCWGVAKQAEKGGFRRVRGAGWGWHGEGRVEMAWGKHGRGGTGRLGDVSVFVTIPQ